MVFIIIAAVAAVILLILALPLKLRVIYDDGWNVYARILLYKHPLYPNTPKENERKKKKKVKNSKNNKNGKNKEKKKKASPRQTIKFIRDILPITLDNILRNTKLSVDKMYVTIGEFDAAKAVLEYGCVMPIIQCIVTTLQYNTNVVFPHRENIGARIDFGQTTGRIDFDCSFTITVYGGIKTIIAIAVKYIKKGLV